MPMGMDRRRRAIAALLCLVMSCAPLLSACGETSGALPQAAATAAPTREAAPTAYPERREAEPEFDKEETVYAKADAAGKLRSVTVESVLHYAGQDGRVEDLSRLREIKNTEGDEEFTRGAGDLLYWEDHGEKIRYEGKSDEPLPVAVKLRYFLDGKEIAPEKLAGKSGKLRIRFDYENRSAVTVGGLREGEDAGVETCVPFLAISIVLLPEEVFRSVKATEGRLLSLGDQSVFLGYAFPGLEEALPLKDYALTEELELPAYAELEAEVENFSLDFTATIFSNSLFRELESEDLDELDDFAEATGDFLDALTKLSDGANALADGSENLDQALKGYTGGVHSLAQGAKALSNALSGLSGQFPAAQMPLDSLLELLSGTQLDSAAEALRREALALRDSPEQLRQLDEALRGAKELFAALRLLAVNADTLSDTAIQLSDAGPKLLDAIAALSDGAAVLADGLGEFEREGSEELEALGGEKLRALVTRLRALRQADLDYESFSGVAPGRSCSVRFIIETEAIG